MKHFLLYLFILILVAPAWGQKMTGQATAPKVSGTTTSTKPCVTCTMSSQGGAPPISFGKIRNPLSPQTASGAILVDDGDPSVLSQDGSWVFSGKNLDNDGNQHPMYFDFQGIYGNLSGFWPTTLQARYDFTQGAVISLYPSEQHSDPTYPGHPLEVTHPDVSGSIIMTSTRNDNIGDRFFGPSLILQQYVDNGHPESDKYWPSLLYISKRGDVILGDKRFHSNNRGSDIDASGHYVDRKSGSNSYYSGTKLFFSGDESMSEEVWDNACPLFMQRYNRELYNSELRVNIGYASGHYMDDSRQRVVFGAYDQDEGSWPLL